MIKKYAPLIITFILFLIPFFWLKPGEIDLGGDTSRLYYYDPAGYFQTNILYNVVSSGIGGEFLSYQFFPYMLFLIALKTFFFFHSNIEYPQRHKTLIGIFRDVFNS